MISPAISVVMSVFNGEAFLVEAVESILVQSFDDLEFVIIDDGSTDATPKILDDHARKDKRIRILRHDNMGRAASLNIGIELARGKYIARMDADDIALPNRLEEQIMFMEKHPDVGLLGGAFELITETGKVLSTVRFPSQDSEIRSAMLIDNPICHPTVFMRKAVAQASGGYRKPLVDADDYDLWLRMRERTKLANLSACILKYRVHPRQVSVRNMTNQKMCVLAARAAAVRRARGLPDPLTHVEQITPALLESLGVSKSEIQENILCGYQYWANLLEKNYPDAALASLNGILEMYDSAGVGRRETAEAWITTARIHYRCKRPMKAFFSVGRGILVRPTIAARPFRKAWMRLAGLAVEKRQLRAVKK